MLDVERLCRGDYFPNIEFSDSKFESEPKKGVCFINGHSKSCEDQNANAFTLW